MLGIAVLYALSCWFRPVVMAAAARMISTVQYQYMEELSQLTARWSGIGDDKASYSP